MTAKDMAEVIKKGDYKMIILRFKSFEEMEKAFRDVKIIVNHSESEKDSEKDREVEMEDEEQIQEMDETKESQEIENKEEAAGKITIEQIREIFVTKNYIKGNTPKLKALLNEFGVKKVTDLKEEDFPEILKRLEEI